jgi:hypothetical protein
MIAAGTLRTIVHGRRRLVPAHELERLFSAIEVEQRIPRTAVGAKATESA